MQAMESITAKISAIFDNDDDAWQKMTLEVGARVPPLSLSLFHSLYSSRFPCHLQECATILGVGVFGTVW